MSERTSDSSSTTSTRGRVVVGEVEHLVGRRSARRSAGKVSVNVVPRPALAVDLDGAAGGADDVVGGGEAEAGAEARAAWW